MARLGGYSGWEPLIYSHSSRITVGPDLTWTEAAGNGPPYPVARTASRIDFR